jgi:hypothetical protein
MRLSFLAAVLIAALSACAGSSIALRDQSDARHRELADAARRAAEALAERQQRPGYWLTAVTGETRFEGEGRELNVFTNALLVDILDPLPAGAVMASRARAFLASQIEPDGLVRYYGRPELKVDLWRCIITPDADDTALVWRISPDADRDRLSKALATLGEYRSADGLYRAWLAPQDRYQCIAPGRDPNPTDIAIQMHVLMLLAQVDRPAALALCDALSKASSDDRVWVYYEVAPLVPLLRLADMHKAHCALELPPARLQTTVPGQETWLEVARLLGRMERAQAGAAEYSRAEDLLEQLAAGGFSRIRTHPPLLYHTDFTAPQPKRYFWSDDVGYALWLRLHSECESKRPGRSEAAPT